MTRRAARRLNAASMRLLSRPIPWARLSIACALAFGLFYAAGQYAGIWPDALDARAYWLTDPADPYRLSVVGGDYSYLYSPAFIQAFVPFHRMPWPVFISVWTILMVAAFVWTAREWSLPLLLVLPVISALAIGNIEFFLAAAIVAGFRRPAAWAFVLLTKSTLGVGLVWFAVRREWRSLAIALGATVLVVLASAAIAPGLWSDWIGVLQRNEGVQPRLWTLPGPLWLRTLIGAVVVGWGARTDRRWTVPVGVSIALPVAWASLFAILLVGLAGVYVRRERRAPAPSSVAVMGEPAG